MCLLTAASFRNSRPWRCSALLKVCVWGTLACPPSFAVCSSDQEDLIKPQGSWFDSSPKRWHEAQSGSFVRLTASSKVHKATCPRGQRLRQERRARGGRVLPSARQLQGQLVAQDRARPHRRLLASQTAERGKGCLFSSQNRNSQKIDSPSLTMHTK